MADDDDWFESALNEDGTETESGADDEAAESADDEAAESADGEEPESIDGEEREGERGTEPPTDGEEDERPAESLDDEFGGSDFDDGEFDDADFDGSDEFGGGDFDDADFDDADFDDADFDDADFDDEFGGSDGGDLFEDDFADAFAGADDQMGGGMGDLGGTDDFDEEDFDSDIPRISLGIEGLDSMIQGGIPDRSLMVVMGSAGTGKTTFGLQFIGEALESGERAAFITLEETEERIVNTAEEKGWEFGEHQERGDLAIVDLDPVEMANSLSSIRNELPKLVDEFGASRLVLDSVSLLELMYDNQATRRTEIYQFTKALKDAGVTTMVTSEAASDDPFTSRYGIIEYLTDAVFVLRYIRGEDFRETRLAVEIQKIRDANHSRETKPYEITNTGIAVYRQANIF